MLENISLPLAHSASQGVQSSTVIELIQQSREELDVACGIDKVSARSLVLGLPNLKLHGFRKHLLCQLMFSSKYGSFIDTVMIDYVGSLTTLVVVTLREKYGHTRAIIR